jgi:uncharacterized phage protein (TIGR02220 family)
MYVKIFRQIYDSTLADDWKALVTFQQLLILCNQHGEVDMTPEAIARTTNLPLDIILAGLTVLSEPDPRSRSKLEEGRRVTLLEESRPWGWRLVNYNYYRLLRNAESKREYDREYMANKRKKSKESRRVVSSRSESQESSQAVSSKQEAKGKDNYIVSQRETAHEILTFLNQKTGKAFRPVSANLDLILARLKEGATAQNCRTVIARKRMDWGDDPKMVQYLRPATLFNKIKFAQYLGECVIPPEDQSDDTPPAVKELTHAMRTV